MFSITGRRACFARLSVACILGLSLAGCKKEQPVASGGVDLATAKKIFETRCVVCHGASGKGDGPGAKTLKPPPRDYTDAKWQASITDETLKKIILTGGAGVGKSPLMPPNPVLKGKDAVISGLVKIVRDFKK